jgi:hypothetical protein
MSSLIQSVRGFHVGGVTKEGFIGEDDHDKECLNNIVVSSRPKELVNCVQ